MLSKLKSGVTRRDVTDKLYKKYVYKANKEEYLRRVMMTKYKKKASDQKYKNKTLIDVKIFL